MFGFFTKFFKKPPKISPTRAEKIKFAEIQVKQFLDNTFERNNAVNDRDPMDPRFRIHDNANRIIQKMRRDDTTPEDFNLWYDELTNIGNVAHTGHTLYRDIEILPHPDNSFFGILGRIFAFPYIPERKPDTTVVVEAPDHIIDQNNNVLLRGRVEEEVLNNIYDVAEIPVNCGSGMTFA